MKQFLRIKDMNTFTIPEIIHDKSLIFSPHVCILGILFRDRAFAPYNLTSKYELSKLYIPPGRNQLPLPLNRELDDIPAISPTKPLSYSTLLPWIKKLGQITGSTQVTRPHSLRYAGGKTFNKNGNVSEEMQNLMMGHGSIGIFLKHYLSRRVTVDTQAVVRGIEPQNALMRAALNDHPTIPSLLEEREKLKRNPPNATKHPKYKELNRKINQERQRQRHALPQDIKERWEYEQPVRDIEQQLAAKKALVDAVTAPPGVTLEEEIRRRNRAIRVVTKYCEIEEGGMRPSRPKQSSSRITSPGKSEDASQLDPDKEAIEAAKVSVYKEKRPTICFICLGEDVPMDQRIQEFSTPGDLSKHFKRKHLKHIKEGDSLGCKLCQVSLAHKMHLQQHALEVHGTVS
ncbi:hypothetical protein K469DRAFT_742556 [Zopfia rhizophila CBS 207.26]|uniref:C2H2-type domain-containing protein n=1 Tax=Zopfia rhizophila CBS 207.26 TaxID=1314779 RepID=A0A6A6DEB1_9PEZI|nr:hypothetical protein K469DRAFT_742556 [Zopfia rhizophila CBS 207.26]